MPPFRGDQGADSGGIHPSIQGSNAENEAPDPQITSVSVPEGITIGESFGITVEGTNYGGRGGHYSTISISSPTLDDSTDGSQLQVTDASDHAYHAKRTRGDNIYDNNGNQITANYALVEAGSDNETYWSSGESRTLTVEFTPETTGTFLVDIRVTLPDDENESTKYNSPSSSNYRDQQGYYVERHEIEVREEADISATLHSAGVDSGTYGQNGTVEAEARVENTGNREHTFFVGYSVFGPNGNDYDNNDSTGDTLRLQPGEDRWVSLSWDVQSNAPDGGYDAQIAVWKESDRDNLQTSLDEQWISDAFTIERTSVSADITTFDPASGTFQPGEVAQTTVRVANTGTTDHSFFVGYTLYGPDGGKYDNKDSTGTAISIPESDERYVDLSWEVPSDAPSGEYEVYVAVWKESDRHNLQTKLDDASNPSAFTVKSAAADITAQIQTYSIDSGEFAPGEQVSADVVIENTGEQDHEFFVGYTTYGPEGGEYDNNNQTGQPVTIRAGNTETVLLSWTVPSGIPPGEYDADIAVWKESNRDSLQTELDRVLADNAFTVTENQAEARIQSISTEPGPYTEGQVVPTTVEVSNTGDQERTFYIGYSVWGPNDEEYDNNDTTGQPLSIEPGDTETVIVEWQVTREAPLGEYDVEVVIWQESDPDRLSTRLEDVRNPEVFEVKDTLASASITELQISEGPFTSGDAIEIRPTVRNDGETDHTFFIEVELVDETGTAITEETIGRQLSLPPDAADSASVSWNLSETYPSGEYDLRTLVWSERDPSNLQTTLASVIREDAVTIENPTVTVPDIQTRPQSSLESFDTTGEVTARLQNGGESDVAVSVEHRIIGPSGDVATSATDSIQIQSGQTQSTKFSWDLDRNQNLSNGDYAYEIALFTRSGKEILTRTKSDAFTLDIAGLGRTDFSFELLEANGTPINDGRLELEPVAGGSGFAASIQNGSVEFSDIPTGLYNVVVEHGDTVLGETFQTFVREQLTEQVYVVSALKAISGSVVDDTGDQQVPNANVRLAGVEETTTDNLGQYSFDTRVPDGEYDLVVESPDGSAVRKTIGVDSDRNISVQTNQALVPDEARSQQPDSDVISEENQLVSVLARYLQNNESEEIVIESYTDQVHGLVKGVVASIIDTFENLKEAVKTILSLDIGAVLRSLSRFIGVLIEHPGRTLQRLVTAIVQDTIEGLEEIHDQQLSDNPYEPPNPRAYTFMSGWYQGYIGFSVLLTFVGAKAASVASRTVLTASDSFTDAMDSGMTAIRQLNDADRSVGFNDYGKYANAIRRSNDDSSGFRGILQGSMKVREVVENSKYPEQMRRLLDAAYVLNHRQAGRFFGGDSDRDYIDPMNPLRGDTDAEVSDIKGNIAEVLLARKFLDESSRFPNVHTIMREFDPSRLPTGKKGILLNWEADSNKIDGEFDLVEVEMKQLEDGAEPKPVVTNIWEGTTTRETSLDYTEDKKRRILQNIIEQSKSRKTESVTGKGLDAEAFYRDGLPSINPLDWKVELGIPTARMQTLADELWKKHDSIDPLFKPEGTNE